MDLGLKSKLHETWKCVLVLETRTPENVNPPKYAKGKRNIYK
jgi:hypothetical protein